MSGYSEDEGESRMIKAPNNICPRCGGGVPNDLMKGVYVGALSRTDNLTEICSDCGVSEAMEQMAGLLPQDRWTVK